MKIYNTLTREIEEFKPIKKGKAGLYTCGPTVYNYAHIGNLRTYVFEDILKRVLEYNKYKVKHIMNITDVGHLTDDADQGEDKMEKGSAREGKSAWDIAKFYTKAFENDLKDLNIIFPTKFTKATDNIKEQINLIKKLEKKGFTYQTKDGVYFDTSKLKDYGKLAQLDKQDLKAGSRVEMGDKKNSTDFALWKFSTPLSPPARGGVGGGGRRQMEWKSPWGVGFPGWHIECSAMAAKYLGQPFDIHCGGIDHIPVHHTNEIAQSEAAEGKPLANYWMHGEFLLMGSDKMAKSGDNFVTLQTLKEHGISPLAYRYLLLQTHYRKQLTFSWEALQAAQNGLDHLYKASAMLKNDPTIVDKDSNMKEIESFEKSIYNDLDIPGALSWMWILLQRRGLTYKKLLEFDKVLGLQIDINVKRINKIKTEKKPPEIQKLISARNAARTSKDWVKSDELRKEIEALGYTVEDRADGTKIIKI